jgi:hypothetical protein
MDIVALRDFCAISMQQDHSLLHQGAASTAPGRRSRDAHAYAWRGEHDLIHLDSKMSRIDRMRESCCPQKMVRRLL